ncbi:MAG: hypothetical protein R6V06_04280 [Kiritimatiellia bacterium]
MKIVRLMLCEIVVLFSFFAIAAEEPAAYKATVLPEPVCTLGVPLKLGYQLGIPAHDNSAFYAECFSKNALRHEIDRLNESVEIGLLVSHKTDPQTGELSVLLNNQSEELKGVTLRSGHLLRGRTYIARVKAEKLRGDRGIVLRVRHEHVESARCEMKETLSMWRKESELEWEFVPDASGFYRWSFLIEPDSEIRLREFSLLPEDSVSIWRRASIDILRSAGAGAFRWPVVEGMDFYNWYDGIGIRSTRTPVQPEKTGLKHHDFGTAEYVNFCRSVGVEPLICVPLYTPACSDRRVKNLNEATRTVADWVAYCNADDGHPLAALRKKNGLGEPLRVRYWEIVAPAAGALLSAEMIASACLQTIDAMKAEDPGIMVGVTLQDRSEHTLDVLLQQAGGQMDFISSHAAGAYEKVRTYNKTGGGSLMFAGTTLKADYGDYAAGLLAEFRADSEEVYEYYINWYRSLGLANAAVSRLNSAMDGPVCLPYYAEQVLGLKYGCTGLSTDIGLLSAMIGRFPAVKPLEYQMDAGCEMRDAGAPAVYPAWTDNEDVLIVFAYNPKASEQILVLDVSQLKKKFAFWIMDQLSAEITEERRGETVPVLRHQKAGDATGMVLECPLKPMSFTRILVKE